MHKAMATNVFSTCSRQMLGKVNETTENTPKKTHVPTRFIGKFVR